MHPEVPSLMQPMNCRENRLTPKLDTMLQKLLMHHKAFNAFIAMVQEESLPVSVQAGESMTDPNGDRQVSVLLEYEQQDARLIDAALEIVMYRIFII